MSDSTLPENLGNQNNPAGRRHEVCEQFENAWRAGNRPSIEDYVNNYEHDDKAALLLELILVEKSILGKEGASSKLGEYVRCFPEEYRSIIEAAWWPEDKLRTLTQMLASQRSEEPGCVVSFVRNDISAAGARGEHPSMEVYLVRGLWPEPVQRAIEIAIDLTPSHKPRRGHRNRAEVPKQIGKYVIQEKLGRGGEGEVYKAARSQSRSTGGDQADSRHRLLVGRAAQVLGERRERHYR